MYADLIRQDLAALGLIGRYDAADVEAWMRLEHGTLDSLSEQRFRSEVNMARQCIDAATRDDTASLRASYGL